MVNVVDIFRENELVTAGSYPTGLEQVIEQIRKELSARYQPEEAVSARLMTIKGSPHTIPHKVPHWVVEKHKEPVGFLEKIAYTGPQTLFYIDGSYFNESLGRRDLRVAIQDRCAEPIIMKHLLPFADANGITTIYRNI